MTRPGVAFAAVLVAPLVGVLLMSWPAGARTWHVNPAGTGDVPDIHTAMTRAAPGDTVELACGTYHEYDIALASGVCLRSQTGEWSCATIDGQYHGPVLTGTGLAAGTRVEGITVARGGMLLPGAAASGADVVTGAGSEPIDIGPGPGLELSGSSLEISRCRFTANIGYLQGGGIAARDGGALSVASSLFDGNTCFAPGNPRAGQGGAIYGTHTAITLTRDVFGNNRVGDTGGALYCDDPAVTVAECVFSRNHAGLTGNAMTGFGSVSGSTFFGNDGGDGGLEITGPTGIANSIIAFGRTLACGVAPVLSCCDVFGNTGGDWVGCLAGQEHQRGNFAGDPAFCDTTRDLFTLDGSSPCLPGQDPEDPDCGLIGALPRGCGVTRTGVAAAAGSTGAAQAGVAGGAFSCELAPGEPNPFSATTVIRYRISGTGWISLRIVDAAGRAVRVLANAREAAGSHEARWDGRDERGRPVPAGVYFCLLRGPGSAESRRIVRLP